MDPLKDFWSDWIFDPAAWTPANALWNAYQVWAEANGERAITRTKFGARLSGRGCVATKERGVRGWRGIKLAEDAKIGAHGLTFADLEASA